MVSEAGQHAALIACKCNGFLTKNLTSIRRQIQNCLGDFYISQSMTGKGIYCQYSWQNFFCIIKGFLKTTRRIKAFSNTLSPP